jgi:hypothetical protein
VPPKAVKHKPATPAHRSPRAEPWDKVAISPAAEQQLPHHQQLKAVAEAAGPVPTSPSSGN